MRKCSDSRHAAHAQSLIRAFSQSLNRAFALHPYILQYPMILLADREGFDQTAWMRRLIWTFAVCICPDMFSHGVAHIFIHFSSTMYFHNTYYIQSTLVISKSKGLSKILRDIRTSTYQICRIEEKINRTTTFNKCICNLTPEVRDITIHIIFCYLLLDFHV